MEEHEEAAAGQHLCAHDTSLLTTTLALSPEQRLLRLIAHVRFVTAGRAALEAAGRAGR